MSKRRKRRNKGFLKVDVTPRIKKQHRTAFWNPDNAPPVYVKIPAAVFYASEQWNRLRYQAFKKYGNRCACCGASPLSGAVMHVDHIKPRHRFPELSLDIDNLQILCEACNIAKSDKDCTSWR